jgi:hypothetical protein
MNMPCKIKGYVAYSSTDDYYTIVLNSRLSFFQNKQTFEHEMVHIKNGDFFSNAGINLIENYSH